MYWPLKPLIVDLSGVDYGVDLLAFWRHPFTAMDPLVSKWCNANFSKSIPMK